jgi:hypothetical protein
LKLFCGRSASIINTFEFTNNKIRIYGLQLI